MITARLEITDPLGRHRLVPIDRSPFTIGRSGNNALPLVSAEISREHAAIIQDGQAFRLEDRGSRAGTFVNDAPIKDHVLRNGDRIRIGAVELRFALGDASDTTGRATTTVVGDLRQTAALLDGLRALGSGRVLEQVLAMVLDSAITLSSAERGFIMLAAPSGGLEFKLGRDRYRLTLPGGGFQTSRKIPEGVFRSGKPRSIADLRDDPSAADHARTIEIGIRNVVCVPLKLVQFADAAAAEAPVQEESIGVLYLDSREKGALQSRSTLTALETLATEAAVAIENARLYRDSVEKAQLDRELLTAREFQQGLLPQAPPARSFFAAAATMLPCRAIGGDFFDYLDFGDHALGFTVGDVAGKGIPAGLLAARVQEIFTTRGVAGESPSATLLSVNKALVRRGLEARFVTLFFGILTHDGRLAYCNAGHNPPLLIGQDGVRRLDCGGLILGLFEDAEYEADEVQLQAGDLLVAFSDGISEASDSAGHEFGDARILQCVKHHGNEPEPRRIVERLFESVRAFTAGEPQGDDMTVLALRYRG